MKAKELAIQIEMYYKNNEYDVKKASKTLLQEESQLPKKDKEITQLIKALKISKYAM